jgi:kynurenine formamidase
VERSKGSIVNRPARRSVPTDDEVLEYTSTLSNWNRWGPDDELGTLNFVTPEKRLAALRLPARGESISCSWDVDVQNGPEHHLGPPQRHFLSTGEGLNDTHRIPPAWAQPGDRQSGATEYIGMVFHGYGITHLDALAHMFWDGKMYNGYPAEWVTSRLGATRLDVTGCRDGIVTRGVLVDAARHRDVPWLQPGDAVTRDEVEEILAAQNVVLEPGDALLLRTGAGRAKREAGANATSEGGQAGWHASCLPLFHDHDVAMIACDTAQDAIPSGYEQVRFPIHIVGIVAMGLWLIDNCDLEALAARCASLGTWECCLTVTPLVLAGCTGSPVNPVATL